MSKKEINKMTEESVVYKGNANHIKGIESVGGKLFLTSDELIFQSHKINVQTHTYKIKVKEIEDIKCSFFPPNAFEYTTKNSKKEKFVVNGRKKWIEKIESIK